MREYDSAIDYPVILAGQREEGAMSIARAARDLCAGGVRWPNLQDLGDASASAIDRDLLRAWRELGYHPGS